MRGYSPSIMAKPPIRMRFILCYCLRFPAPFPSDGREANRVSHFGCWSARSQPDSPHSRRPQTFEEAYFCMDDCAVDRREPQHRVRGEWDVIVIGAGPAGLTAGYLLTKDNSKRTLILEAGPDYVGGISRTERHRGYSFDIGGHRFFTKSKAVEEFWAEILPHGFPWRSRSSKIFFDRKFYTYPLHALEALANLGVTESALCVLSYAKARMLPVEKPASFHEWVANQFGERFFQLFFKIPKSREVSPSHHICI